MKNGERTYNVKEDIERKYEDGSVYVTDSKNRPIEIKFVPYGHSGDVRTDYNAQLIATLNIYNLAIITETSSEYSLFPKHGTLGLKEYNGYSNSALDIYKSENGYYGYFSRIRSYDKVVEMFKIGHYLSEFISDDGIEISLDSSDYYYDIEEVSKVRYKYKVKHERLPFVYDAYFNYDDSDGEDYSGSYYNEYYNEYYDEYYYDMLNEEEKKENQEDDENYNYKEGMTYDEYIICNRMFFQFINDLRIIEGTATEVKF